MTGQLLANAPVYFVALAGGIGERLWPLSRKALPKQFLCLQDNKTLLNHTLDRVAQIVPESRFWVVTTQNYTQLVRSTCTAKVDHVLTEPALRNTAPAICLTAMQIAHENPDAIIVFLPSDHYISPVDHFKTAVQNAVEYCRSFDVILLIGIEPNYPATEYGYFKCSRKNDISCSVLNVLSFHEKPTLEQAKNYLDAGCMLWNAGIFCARAKTFIEEIKTHAPAVYQGVCSYIAGSGSYAAIPEISIDYAVMEKCTRLKAIPLDVAWSDVGNLREFLSIKQKCTADKNLTFKLGSGNSLVHGQTGKAVVLIDVADICVVDTPDVLMIARKDVVEKVKNARAQVAMRDERYV